MQKTLEDAKNGNAAAVERVRKAFGPNPDLDGIKKNVDILHTGTVPISKLSPDEVDKAWNGGKPLKKGQTGIIAITPFDYRKSANDPLTVDPVQFGTGFNVGAESRKMNAATVLHEATHSLLHTSDDHYKDGTMDVVPMGVEHSDAQWKNIKEQGGCTCCSLCRYWPSILHYMRLQSSHRCQQEPSHSHRWQPDNRCPFEREFQEV